MQLKETGAWILDRLKLQLSSLADDVLETETGNKTTIHIVIKKVNITEW